MQITSACVISLVPKILRRGFKMAAPSGEESSDERFELSKFLETWVDILPESYFLTNIDKDLEHRIMKTEMDISDEMLQELESLCSVDALKEVDGETEDEKITDDLQETDESLYKCLLLHVIPECSVNKLITLRTHKQYLTAQEAMPSMKRTFLPQMLDFNTMKLKKPEGHSPRKVSDAAEMEYECMDADIILTIQVFQPMLYHKGKCTAFVDCEYVVRGTTLLCEFRDVLQCVRDSIISADISDDPDPRKYNKAKDVYKSGFFYIDEVFYNDMRDPSAIDYSSKIIQWGRRGELQRARAVEMRDLRFMDLKLKLNEVYLYQHQGDCEHVFTFTDIRLVHEDDPPNIPNMYPMLTKSKHKKRMLCRGCSTHHANWLLQDDPHAIDDPTYLCDLCLKTLHYDETGKRVKSSGNFRAFYFCERAALNAHPLLASKDQSTTQPGTSQMK